MKKIAILTFMAVVSLNFMSCKKDDKSSDSTTSTTTNSTTSTTSATDPNTMIYEGEVINKIKGTCDYSNELYVSGEVTATDGTKYFIDAEFAVPEPEGNYTTVRSPTDPISATQCHITLNRIKGTYEMDMLPPNGATVKVVKNGMKYKVSFGTIKFEVIKGANGTRSVSCTGFGCE